MSSDVFIAYTEFFTHTQSICFYLQAREWQIAAEDTIDRLTDSSADVVQKLESAEGIQHELLRKQNDSVHIQQQLLDDGAELQQTLQESKVDVQTMMQEFQTAVSEQKNLKNVVFEVIHRVQALQSIVTGEFMGFYSLIFYLLSLVIAYLLTSMPRTSGARFWLFLILSMNVAFERMIVMWADVSGQLDPVTGHPADENTLLYFQLRTCRKCFVTVAVGVWCWIAYRFRDINEINNQILMQVQQQNDEIKALIKTHGSPMLPSRSVFDTPDAAISQTISSGHNSVSEISVCERVETGPASGLHAGENKASVGDEPAADAVQHSTPATDMIDTRPPAMSDQPVRAAGRRRRPAALSSSLLTPSFNSTRRYNLRSRVSLPTPQPADELSVEVRRLAHLSESNRVRALHAVEQAYNRFSSDED